MRSGAIAFRAAVIPMIFLVWRLSATGAEAAVGDVTSTRQIVLEGLAGSDTPLGVYGLALDGDLTGWLSVLGGVGMEVINQTEVVPRYALVPHVRYFLAGPATSLSLGAGLSYGKRNLGGQGYGSGLSRLEGEISVEHRFSGGVRLRGFAGLSRVLGVPDIQAQSPEAGMHGFGGLGLGYALSPNPPASDGGASLRRWYGWQSLALDATAGLIPLLTDASECEGHICLSGGGSQLGRRHIAHRAATALYLVSGPIVHVAHRNPGKAGLSAGVRVLGPLIFGLLGMQVTMGDGGENMAVTGAVVGAVIASLVDGIAFGHAPRDTAELASLRP